MVERFCKVCEHFQRGVPGVVGSRCIRPLEWYIDPVTGLTAKRLNVDPWDERKTGRSFWTARERCGEFGNFWQPKAETKKYGKAAFAQQTAFEKAGKYTNG